MKLSKTTKILLCTAASVVLPAAVMNSVPLAVVGTALFIAAVLRRDFPLAPENRRSN